MATSANVATRLRKCGIHVESFTEGDDSVDGTVNLSPMVHVQVGFYSPTYGVVRVVGDSFEFFPERRSIAALLPDIRKAMGLVAEVSA